MRRSARNRFGLCIALAAGVVLVLLPLLSILLAPGSASVGGDQPALAAFTDPILLRLLGTSFGLALATAGLALLLGVPIGVGLGLGSGGLFRAAAWIHCLPLCLPPYIVALGFTAFSGRSGFVARCIGEGAAGVTSSLLYSPWGVVGVLVISLAPLISLTTALAVRRIDPARLEAALLSRSWPAVLGRVALPLTAPGIGVGVLLVFVLAFGEVGVPQLLRVPVYATTVFSRLADLSFEPGLALARSLPPLLLALAGLAALIALDHRGRSSLGLRSPARDARLTGLVRRVSAVILGLAVVMGLLPLAALLGQALTSPGGGAEALFGARDAMISSLVHSALAAVAMVAVAIPAAWSWSRRPGVGALAVTPLLFGLLIPSAVLGTGLVLLWNHPATRLVYDSSWIMVIGLAARYSIVPLRALKVSFDRAPPSWMEVARMHEPSAFKRFFTVVLRGNLDGVFGALGLAFVVSLRDLDTVVLFYPPGMETLPVRAMTLEANAPPGLTATTAVLQIALTAGALLIARFALSLGKSASAPDGVRESGLMRWRSS